MNIKNANVFVANLERINTSSSFGDNMNSLDQKDTTFQRNFENKHSKNTYQNSKSKGKISHPEDAYYDQQNISTKTMDLNSADDYSRRVQTYLQKNYRGNYTPSVTNLADHNKSSQKGFDSFRDVTFRVSHESSQPLQFSPKKNNKNPSSNKKNNNESSLNNQSIAKDLNMETIKLRKEVKNKKIAMGKLVGLMHHIDELKFDI